MQHGFLLRAGTFTNIDFPGSSSTGVSGVNDFGVITGEATLLEGTTEAFRLTASRYKVIRFPGATSTSAGDVSNSGQVIGIYVDTRSLTHGFLWTAAGFQESFFRTCSRTIRPCGGSR